MPASNALSVDFDKIASLKNIWAAALRAARGKRHRASVARTLFNLEGTVLRLQAELLDGSWRASRSSQHQVFDPKQRLITAAAFEDRIVHQVLCAVIGPVFERHLIPRSYACRVGLGTHAAIKQARLWARTYPFALHLDVAKYFPSIDHEILGGQIRRDLSCERTVALCEQILKSGLDYVSPPRWHFPGDTLFTPLEREAGLPIGNLTSQHFANRYLSPVDHRATDRLRIRAYLRYMDDMLLFGEDRQKLQDCGHEIEEACWKQRLRLHAWQVVKTSEGIGWLGFRILPDEIRVKRSSVIRAQKRLRSLHAQAATEPEGYERFLSSLRATFAHWSYADSFRLKTNTLRELGILEDISCDELSEGKIVQVKYPDKDKDDED